MKIGINYPWRRHGWDFGPSVLPRQNANAPPAWDDSLQLSGAAGPMTRLEGSLQQFRSIGIRDVRWFILADGWNCEGLEYKDRKWDYRPKSVEALGMVSHFERALQVFQRADCVLLPSLISHQFFMPARIYLAGDERPFAAKYPSVKEFVDDFYRRQKDIDAKQQRASDPDWNRFIKCGKGSFIATRESRQLFYDNVLTPFLKVSQKYAATVPVWELINEPDGAPGVKPELMYSFLAEGCSLIAKAGFAATIGFQKAGSLTDFVSRAAQDLAVKDLIGSPNFIRQFHYYINDGQGTLPSCNGCILGEFATVLSRDWPLDADQATPTARYRMIVQKIEAAGATAAYAWSYLSSDDRAKWSLDLEDALEGYIRSGASR